MSEFIAFCIGFIVGGLVGIMCMAFMIASNRSRGGEE